MTVVILPKTLHPKRPLILERPGAHCDGGYLIDPRDVKESDRLISMGIAIDWSFEKDFSRYNRRPVLAYDGSLSVW